MITTYDPSQSIGMKVINFIGIIAFGLCLAVSFSLALNFYLNLATSQLDFYIMLAVSVIQEIIKAFTLTKGNFAWDFGFKKKASAFYLVYSFALIASLVSGFGSGLVIVDKKTTVSMAISYEEDIQNKSAAIVVAQGKISDRLEIIQKRKEARDLLPPEQLVDIERIQRTIDVTQREIDKLNADIASIRLEISELHKKEKAENKDIEKTMYTLIADLFGWDITAITAGSFILLVIIVEAGLVVTSVHPSANTHSGVIRKKREKKKKEYTSPSDKPEDFTEEVEEPIIENPVVEETIVSASTNEIEKEEIPLIPKVAPPDGRLFNFPKREKGIT